MERFPENYEKPALVPVHEAGRTGVAQLCRIGGAPSVPICDPTGISVSKGLLESGFLNEEAIRNGT